MNMNLYGFKLLKKMKKQKHIGIWNWKLVASKEP